MVKKEGKYLVNSRVDVDYTKGKPKIKFSYPQKNPKKSDFFQSMVSPLTLIISTILIVILFFFIITYEFDIGNPTSCNYTEKLNNSEITGLNISCDNGNSTLNYYSKINILEKLSGDYTIWGHNYKTGFIFFYFLLILLFYYLIPLVIIFLVGFIFSRFKWYRKIFPKMNAWGEKKYYNKFTKKDVENNMVEIPSFSNVFLEYKPKGDFKKYFTNLKIREHKYYIYKKKKKKIIKKFKKQDTRWYARFYFSQKPENGYLEVIYH